MQDKDNKAAEDGNLGDAGSDRKSSKVERVLQLEVRLFFFGIPGKGERELFLFATALNPALPPLITSMTVTTHGSEVEAHPWLKERMPESDRSVDCGSTDLDRYRSVFFFAPV
ncbi:hypothetical protein QN277_005918 [Acacia crassicarpa]|uniref:Uncharacterized protein n=1 Tax=Acacia crassicarpa TaxID=499986 RepID=A0AAE1J0P5_9FABA|nr:hypothetical protein QN277_005918 [Acacia crassicarpa]